MDYSSEQIPSMELGSLCPDPAELTYTWTGCEVYKLQEKSLK